MNGAHRRAHRLRPMRRSSGRGRPRSPPEHEKVSSTPEGSQQLEREQVDVLVGARGAVHVRARSAPAWADRARSDRSCGASRARGADHSKTSRARSRWRRHRSPLLAAFARASASASSELSIACTERAPPASRGQREAAAVAEGVEHVAVRGEPARERAVVALVEVEAGLVSFADVDRKAQAALLDHERLVGRGRRAAIRCAEAALRARMISPSLRS